MGELCRHWPYNVPAADETTTYRIQAFRPLKVGDQLHLKREIELTLTSSTTVDGIQRGQQTSAMQVKFAGNLKVVEVDASGVPIKWEGYTELATGAATAGGRHVELLKPGTIFTAQGQGGTFTITVADTKATPNADAQQALARVFEAAGTKGEMSLGEVLDSKSPQPIGGTWEINTKAAAEQLHGLDPKLSAAEVAGKARLKGFVGQGDKRALWRSNTNTRREDQEPGQSAGRHAFRSRRARGNRLGLRCARSVDRLRCVTRDG